MELTIIQKHIFEIRGQRIMLDFRLAEMYGVETRVLTQAVKRNANRFPSDFMFQLNKNEFNVLISQIVTSKTEKGAEPVKCLMRLLSMVLQCFRVCYAVRQPLMLILLS